MSIFRRSPVEKHGGQIAPKRTPVLPATTRLPAPPPPPQVIQEAIVYPGESKRQRAKRLAGG